MDRAVGGFYGHHMLIEEAHLRLPARPAALASEAVAVWREPLEMPTYLPDLPSRYPAYLDRRVYQGSSGRVYPLPFHDRISSERRPVAWEAVHLENPWLRLVILPALGGRIHVGLDRTSGYDFFYRNPVIKPALVGLAGPWIAGGVEFNWPQHHRPGTFLPTDVDIEREPDGAVTVWCSDHDPFTRMKGMHGIRLRPDRAAVELRVRLYNRSDTTQTFLWWANVAALVHEDYQSFFPRDVDMVADHAKRAVTAFPAADRPYYGIDYPERHHVIGTAADGSTARGDRLDWYRNIPVPTSYMCLASREGFFGGYDHRARAGFVHVADRWQAVGKKQWTWGNADFGRAWCRNLADDDAEYVELMAGVFTDNQPDFSFIAPGETKVFSQSWYPIQEIGPVHAATDEAAIRVDIDDTEAGCTVRVGLVVTTPRPGCTLTVSDGGGTVLAQAAADVVPGRPWRLSLPISGHHDGDPLVVRVRCGTAELVSWASQVPPCEGSVAAAVEPPAPAAVDSVESLVLIGIHLEQYRHATRSPEPYWQEALRRDPANTGGAIGLARVAYHRAEFAAAESHLRAAVARLTAHNPNPSDTGALYLLGLVLTRRGADDEAYDAFAAASWSRTWRAAAGYRMAQLDAAHGRDSQAWLRVADVLRVEPEHLQARALEVLVLRRLGRDVEATELARATRALDPLDWWTVDLLGDPVTSDAQTCLDIALEYAGAGELSGALRLLDTALEREQSRAPGQPAVRPLLEYHRAAILRAAGRSGEAAEAARAAQSVDAAWCFPVRLDDAVVLAEALRLDPTDARARALLGHWLYAHDRPADAVAHWQDSAALDGTDPVVWRNIGLAAQNHGHDPATARRAYDRALALAPADPQLRFESDQLDQRHRIPPGRRLAVLRAHRRLVEARDDATAEFAHLLMTAGAVDEARKLLLGRAFQPWEGGEGIVLRAWDRVCRLTAERALAGGGSTGAATAAGAVAEALDPPRSLGEARHHLANTARLHLVLGDALAAGGDPTAAARAWELAAGDRGDFVAMRPESFSDATAFSIEALQRLGRDDDADALAAALREDCRRRDGEPAAIDFFATSLPSLLLFDDDLPAVRDRTSRFRRAQLAVAAGDVTAARQQLDELLADDPNHIDAIDLAAVLDGRRARILVGEQV